ncbi:hypothetical protein G6514_005096 [Epicoccum nigrum]|nr:hypothetical protein G6514_005096 [Epicoccum nigrum]
MSYQSQTGTPIEDWEDLMNWDDGRYATESNVVRTSQIDNYLAPEAPASPYITSAPPSNYGGPSSFDCNVSAAPSIVGQSSSYGQFYGTSPTFSSATTSPLLSRDELRYFGSFGACDGFFSSLGEPAEPPLLDTTRDRIVDPSLATTAAGFLNPHVAGSFQTFSNREIVASQILASAGTQFEPTDETIAEGDEYDFSTSTAPIPIIRTPHQSFHDSYGYYEPSQGTYENRTRAVTIPLPNGRTGHNTKASHARWTSNAPPVLSTSPLPGRRSRSGTLSRSNSRAEQRKARASPSPTSAHSLGWVPMQMDSQSGRMSATISSSDTQGRVPKGRKRGLDPKQRSEAALMRIIRSCSNCKKRKEKCDPGTPCRSCLKHYKGDLVINPCRNHALVNLTETFLSNRHGWHPTDRSLTSCIGPAGFKISSDIAYKIPLHFGFGLPLTLEVNPVFIDNEKPLVHEHLVYSWPPQSSTTATHTQPVLPAILSASAITSLSQGLDSHLEHLVLSEFKAFPPYLSPLRILNKVYTFFRSLPAISDSSRLLLQALKLLVLVHVGGDITLPKQSDSTPLKQLVRCTMHIPEASRPSPCLIRAQFGAAMPDLATKLMREVLSVLERILFSRNEDDWPVALAALMVVLMTVESIHYHAAKLPYHDAYSPSRSENADGGFDADDGAVDTLLASYKACFSACHTRLQPDWQGDLSTGAGKTDPADQFVASVREAVGKEGVESYLAGKVDEKFVDEEDMGFFFDRLVARLLLLET